MKKTAISIFILGIIIISSCLAVYALPTTKDIASALDISSDSIVNIQLKASNSEGYGAAIFKKGDFPIQNSNLTKFPFPIKGNSFLVLSTGDANAANNYKNSQYEAGNSNVSGGYVFEMINDLTQLKLTVKVPANVTSFRFDFMFCSEEWPDWYQSKYNDAFVAETENSNFYLKEEKDEYGTTTEVTLVAPNNFALDPHGKPLNINAGYGFDPNNKHPDTGTKYGGCTVPLTASANITNKDQQTIILSVFDASDSVLDSAVFLDNFRFSTKSGEGISICGEECNTNQQTNQQTKGNAGHIFISIMLVIFFLVGVIIILFINGRVTKRIKNLDKKDKSEKNGIISLVLGILSIIFILLPYVGFILGGLALPFARYQKAIKPTELATAGMLLGIIGIVLNTIALIIKVV